MQTAQEVLAAGPSGSGASSCDVLLRARAGSSPQAYAREAAQCDYKVGATLAFIRRERKDGTAYRAPALIGGTRCTQPVLAERCADGKTVRRCGKHIGAGY